MHRLRGISTRVALLVLPTLLMAVPAMAQGRQAASPTPDGFVKYMVFMQNGIFDPATPDTETSAEFYQKQIRGRNDAEIAEHRAEAAEYFLARFGLDFRGTDADSGAVFFGFMDARRNNYRAYTISEDRVPSEGYLVDGGGWMFMVTNPAGVMLHGQYGGAAGLWVPPGTAGVFGEYVVHRTAGESGQPREPIVMRFQSERPIISRADGVVSFQCALRHPVWGEGVAEGVAVPPKVLPDGRIQVAVRNVVTFPPH
ncbi:MAG: hypothetical protein AB7H81_03605 [Vicinamibacterales bacterium]